MIFFTIIKSLKRPSKFVSLITLEPSHILRRIRKNRHWDRDNILGEKKPSDIPSDIAFCLARNNNERSINHHNTSTYLYIATGNACAGHSNVKPVSFVTRSPTSFTDGNWGLVLDAGSKNRTLDDSPICTKPTTSSYFRYAGIGSVPATKIDGRLCADKTRFRSCDLVLRTSDIDITTVRNPIQIGDALHAKFMLNTSQTSDVFSKHQV